MRFIPAARTCCSIAASAPVPSAIIVRTVATPIVIPIVVSAVCSLLRESARRAIVRLDPTVMPLSCRKQRQLANREPLAIVAPIGHDPAVFEGDDARPVFRDLLLVRDEHDRDAALLFEPLKDVHDL